MAHHTIDIMILDQVDANELTGLINQPGFLGTWTDNQTIHLYWEPAHWTLQVHESILVALQTLGIPDPGHLVFIRTLPSQDWNAQWANTVQPITIGKRIRIRPSWEPPTKNSENIELVIDPKQAFGTGHHVTTQLLIEWLEEVIQGGETLLDIGTGSGILGMVALRLGARRVLGIDCDPQAIACAQEYRDLNHFSDELELAVSTLEHCHPYPWGLIVANIDRRTLLEMAGTMDQFLLERGSLLVSGLLRDDGEEIATVFDTYGWTVLQHRAKEEWLALQLIRGDRPASDPPADFPNTQ